MILVVDPNLQRAQQSKVIIEFFGHTAVIVQSVDDVFTKMDEYRHISGALITDQADAYSLIDIVRSLKKNSPSCHIFILSNAGCDLDLAEEIRQKVLGVLENPLGLDSVHAAMHQSMVASKIGEQEAHMNNINLFRSLVGISPSLQKVREMITQVARSNASVLILGESGTGKEVVARNIHYQSERRNQPFVAINCGSIPGELLESELFGHKKGAFTGAVSARQGRFEMARGGTLFLDEIGDMPLAMQVKLLRVLQERTFEPIGSNKSIEADVRVIAATHQDLEKLIDKGDFRQDLFYRLDVFPIHIPALRERPEDIPLLIEELVFRLEAENRRTVNLSKNALASLTQYAWPGNVRELANLMERLSILYSNHVIQIHDLPQKYRLDNDTVVVPISQAGHRYTALTQKGARQIPRRGIDLRDHLNNLETELIRVALKEQTWVVARAAKMLNMQRTTLVEKMRKFNICRTSEAVGF